MVSKSANRNDIGSFVPICYHCGVRKLNLLHCEIWGVKLCHACKQSVHSPHHSNCTKTAEIEEDGLKSSKPSIRTSFKLFLTHHSGRHINIECQPGIAIILEEHWAGTYLYFGASMLLVLEEKTDINHRIVEGLKSLHQ